ncbi:hypothetical protein GOBAR_DD36344 [Gossypium barbadense]|nr:hypothetical protein GOBAR_DD36344 [Gossypium barbadense]
MKGQADTIGIAMRRALLGELEGTCITRAKSEKISHEYSTIVGIQESVHEILMNLKKIVLRGNLYGTRNAFICAKGPGYVTAQDIILPPSVEIVDNTQHVANLTEPIDLCIGLQIERNRGYAYSGTALSRYISSFLLRVFVARIQKGVIHVQASFNNTIVTVTDVRGQVISWSSAGTYGFKGTRRGTPFAAQTAARNAIRAVVDQGMQRAEVMIKGPSLGRDTSLRAIRRSDTFSRNMDKWKFNSERSTS